MQSTVHTINGSKQSNASEDKQFIITTRQLDFASTDDTIKA